MADPLPTWACRTGFLNQVKLSGFGQAQRVTRDRPVSSARSPAVGFLGGIKRDVGPAVSLIIEMMSEINTGNSASVLSCPTVKSAFISMKHKEL